MTNTPNTKNLHFPSAFASNFSIPNLVFSILFLQNGKLVILPKQQIVKEVKDPSFSMELFDHRFPSGRILHDETVSSSTSQLVL